MAPIIEIQNVGKKYYIGERQKYLALRDSLAGLFKSRSGEPKNKSAAQANDFWALKNINFSVEPGEVLGIIGRNGAGKSTLLKILSRITPPTTGEVRLRGRVGSLLEVGTGFHPELTGRENIFLNGAILGMRKKEIEKKFDAIVDFSGVEEFLDLPVKRYSSGMYVRLAFAVAAHLEPEILIVDEVLAVGDAQFQKKCLGKMQEVSQQKGRTVLFVSHNMGAIQTLCNKSILLEKGEVQMIGHSESVIEKYLANTLQLSAVPLRERTDRTGNRDLILTDCYFEGSDGYRSSQVISGDDYTLVFEYECKPGVSLSNVVVGAGVSDQYNTPLFLCHNQMTKTDFGTISGKGKFKCTIKRVPLVPGSYSAAVRVTSNDVELDYIFNVLNFEVLHGDFFRNGSNLVHSKVYVDHQWSLERT